MIRPPFLLRALYHGAVWRMPARGKVLYLTFDDGPTPGVTDKVLAILEQYRAKATFFCIGSNVEQHPELYKRLLTEGHRVGNHTWSHPNALKTDARIYLDDTAKAGKVIESDLFRPPYGRLTPRTLSALRRAYRIIMWDLITGDYDPAVPASVLLERVKKYVRPGSVIVFHDSEKAAPRMLEVLPQVLAYLADQGYRFDRIP
jgi:peptidoglycan/xylan/chitin deacetylase (PgdA/CDA1 family)